MKMLSLRQKLMVANTADGEKEKKWYSATVLDLYDSEALISLPRLQEDPMPLEQCGGLEISFLDGEARYLYQSAIYQQFGREALVIDQPKDVQRIDLRLYPRVSAELEVFFAEVGAGEAGQEFIKGYLQDISGNGLRLASDQLYSPGTRVLVSFDLPERTEKVRVYLEGRVARVIVNDQKDPVEYQLGVEYSRLEKGRQEKIVGYVSQRLDQRQD